MSAKKPPISTINWISCQSCHTRLPNRQLLQRHTELGCGQVFPCINQNTEIINQISLLSVGAITSKEHLPPHSQHILYINSTFINEVKLKTLDWVLVDIVDEMNQASSTPIAMQVWAAQSIPPTKFFISSNGQLAHPLLILDADLFSIRLIEDISLIQSITFNLSSYPTKFDVQELKNDFEDWFQDKPIHIGNLFHVPFLTYLIEAKVESIFFLNEHSKFGRITPETIIKFSFAGDNTPPKDKLICSEITLEMIGGLDNLVLDLINTINHFMTPKGNQNRTEGTGKGILIFGQSGTGKTMIINGICSALGLSKILLENYTKKERSIHEAFEIALQSKEPAAIIIENLDILCSRRRDWSDSTSFSTDLRGGMDRLVNTERIIVIATATNPDTIDISLRLPHVFGRELDIPVPSETDRFQILKKIFHFYNCTLTEDEIKKLAQSTHGFLGADLEALRVTAFRLGNDNPSMKSFNDALKLTKPSAMKSIQLEIPHVRWEDIGGLDELKFNLKQSIEWPRLHPEAFRRVGLNPPKGILMYGPPGCSKTMIAKALATESGINFLSVKGSDLFSKWVGESEKSVQNLFRKARQVAPAILFFDELDALGSERGQQSGGSNVHERVLAQLLVEIDGIEPLNDVTIVAATNRPDLIDTALTRPGRLDRIIYVPLPDLETRREIFKIKTKKMPLCLDVNLDELVNYTQGYSGAEITGICQEAGLLALEEDFDTIEVRMKHFIGAVAKCPRRISDESLAFYANYSKNKISD